MYPAEPGEPLPWQPGHPVSRVRLDPEYTWQHVVFGGVFGLDRGFCLMIGGEDGPVLGYLSHVERRASDWDRQGRPDRLLATGASLRSACSHCVASLSSSAVSTAR